MRIIDNKYLGIHDKIKAIPIVDLNIIECDCWKCQTVYHIYGLNQFKTAPEIMIFVNSIWPYKS